jgi:hypothetical protein
LHSYVSQDNASTALDVVETLLKGIAALSRNPEMGALAAWPDPANW